VEISPGVVVEAKRVQVGGRERRGARAQVVEMIAPGCDGVVRVEPQDGSEQSPVGGHVRRTEHPLGDPRHDARNDRPVHLSASDHRERRACQRHVVGTCPCRVDVVEQVRRRVAPYDDVRAALLDALLDVRVPPRRRVGKRVRRRVQEP